MTATCRCRLRFPHSSPPQLLFALVVGLGLLCNRVLLASGIKSLVTRGDDELLYRWREMLAAKTDDDVSEGSFFEQAVSTTFNTSNSDEANRTVQQYLQLARWVEETRQPNATYLAFLPEFGSTAALEAMRAGVQLAKSIDRDPDALLAGLRGISEMLRPASTWIGYPATRRVILGAMLRKRLDWGGPFPAKVETAADDVLLQLFQLHKTSAANRGAVQFFHISKSGGTNLCQAAEANGCTSQGFDTRTNCLIRDFVDQPRWVTYTAHKYVQYRMSSRQALPWFVNFHTFRPPYTCEQRRAYLYREGFTFYANEYTNPPGTETSSEMCEDFVNLIMFRNPHDRLRSQIGWVQKLYKEFYLDVDTQRAFINRTTGFWERLMPAGVNNYYIRSLLGQRFFEFPIQEVAPEHVTLAKLATLQHDVVLTLEAMARNELALRVGLGWSQALRDDAVRSSSELGDAVALPLDFDTMLARNAPDVEVYAFAREMQTLDTLLWNVVAIADQRLRVGNLTSPHCGYVSLGSPAAASELAQRLKDVVVPPPMSRPVAASYDKTAGSAESSGGEVDEGDVAEGDGDEASEGSTEVDSSAAGLAADQSLRAKSTNSSSVGRREKVVVSISRRLLRLKGLSYVARRRQQSEQK